MTADHEVDWDELLHAWLAIGTPEGWRTEIVDGDIVVSPLPAGAHHKVVGLLTTSLAPVMPDGCGLFHTLGVIVPTSKGGYIPDLCVAPFDRLPQGIDQAGYVTSDAVLLAVEVTSKRNADHDRKAKKWGFGHGGVPLYLLIDRFDDEGPTVSLFSSPVGGTYRQSQRAPFGEPIALPEPFGLEIPTDTF